MHATRNAGSLASFASHSSRLYDYYIERPKLFDSFEMHSSVIFNLLSFASNRNSDFIGSEFNLFNARSATRQQVKQTFRYVIYLSTSIVVPVSKRVAQTVHENSSLVESRVKLELLVLCRRTRTFSQVFENCKTITSYLRLGGSKNSHGPIYATSMPQRL